MPSSSSFRRARKSLSRFRPFKARRSRRLRTTSGGPTAVSPTIAPTDGSRDLDGRVATSENFEDTTSLSEQLKPNVVTVEEVLDTTSVIEQVEPIVQIVEGGKEQEVEVFDIAENEFTAVRIEDNTHMDPVEHSVDAIEETKAEEREMFDVVSDDEDAATTNTIEDSNLISEQVVPSCTERLTGSRSLATVQNERSSNIPYVAGIPNEKPTEFAIHSSVAVVTTHQQHGGKVGTVQRHTSKFVVVIFKESGSSKEFRISPKFLVEEGKEQDAEVFDIAEDEITAARIGDYAPIAEQVEHSVHIIEETKAEERDMLHGVSDAEDAAATELIDDSNLISEQVVPSGADRLIGPLSLATEQNRGSSNVSSVASLPNEKPTEFAIHSNVAVVTTHQQHGGKVGIVKRHTSKFVVVIFKESGNREFRISPKFLVRNSMDSDESISTITTALATHVPSESLAPISSVSSGLGFGFGKYHLERIVLGNPAKPTNIDSVFVKIWGEGNYIRLEIHVDPNEPDDLPMKEILDGKIFELYHAAVGKDISRGFSYHGNPKSVTAYYVHTDDNLREHEETLADFGSLLPSKIWARRSHFLSPAMKLKIDKQPAVKHIHASDLGMVDDVGTSGCGFIDDQYLEDLLGNTSEAKRSLGIQVRIFVPTKGVFKGMLMRKRNVTGEPIQLNESLMKVAPSRSAASDNGYIVIKKTFPSKDNFIVGRLFQSPEVLHKKRLKPITELKGFKNSLKKEDSCKLSGMHERVLKGIGVPKEMIEQYRNQYKNDPKKLCHTHVVGMADPTMQIPPKSVFVTGAMNSIDRLYITRSPCLEAEDGRVVKVARTKPDEMTHDAWGWLQSLSFGAVIFGNPGRGQRPLPELIAEGDLDGDLYFICWDENVLSHIYPVPITDEELLLPVGSVTKQREYDPEWFMKTQKFISQVPSMHLGIDELVGRCYKKSEAFSDIRHPDGVSFARAYKQALDAKKHGKLIILPSHLWDHVPKKLHKYLVSD